MKSSVKTIVQSASLLSILLLVGSAAFAAKVVVNVNYTIQGTTLRIGYSVLLDDGRNWGHSLVEPLIVSTTTLVSDLKTQVIGEASALFGVTLAATDIVVAGAIMGNSESITTYNEWENRGKKGVADGYASLDSTSRMPDAQIPTTVEKVANKNAASGYPGLDASSKLNGAQQVYGTAANTAAQGNDSRLTDARTPLAHATSHKSGGTDALKLDELAAPTDVTTLDVSTTAHGLVPKLPGGTTTFFRADGTYAAPGGGSDPWTTVRLGSDFVTSSASAVDVTGMGFTPTANNRYEVEGLLLVRTATATVGPRPGVAWPTGLTDGVASLSVTASTTSQGLARGNSGAAVLCPVGGLPNTTQSWPADITAVVVAGASPSGTFRLQLASETAGTNVTMVAGSFIRYRTVL